jgi:hypothetical protein
MADGLFDGIAGRVTNYIHDLPKSSMLTPSQMKDWKNVLADKYNAMDLNHDGRVTSHEKATKTLLEVSKQRDTSNDGRVDTMDIQENPRQFASVMKTPEQKKPFEDALKNLDTQTPTRLTSHEQQRYVQADMKEAAQSFQVDDRTLFRIDTQIDVDLQNQTLQAQRKSELASLGQLSAPSAKSVQTAQTNGRSY